MSEPNRDDETEAAMALPVDLSARADIDGVTEEDLKAAEVWLKANASPDPYGSWRMFEKSTIRLRHDLARFRAQAREEGRIAGAVAMRERAVEIAAQIMRDRAARTVAGMSDSYLVELVEEIRALKSEGEGA